jgi:aspartate/methionine/tyrosine aminotransferase
MVHSAGIEEARESVAQYLSKYPSKHKLMADVSCVDSLWLNQLFKYSSLPLFLLFLPPSSLRLSQDIFMTCGTHGALEMCFRVLCEPGTSILLSSPCYTIYRCLASALKITAKHYKLLVRQFKVHNLK